MKTYIFKSTKNNNNNSGNSAKNMNKEFAKKILEFAPYLKPDTYEKINLTTSFKKPKPKFNINGIEINDFISACMFLDNYKKTHIFGKDEYDFELPDGTPVRIFDDEIQIGYEIYDFDSLLIPKFYTTIPEKKKKIIIDIAIKLKH